MSNGLDNNNPPWDTVTESVPQELFIPSLQVKIKIVNPLVGDKIDLPTYATRDAAAFDLRACILQDITLEPQETVLIPTGIAMAIPEGWCGLIQPRSGLGHKHGIVLGNLIGTIDSDYRNEVFVSLWNRSLEPYTVQPNERIAQMRIAPSPQADLVVVEELDDTEREGGFGSTGRT